MNKIFEYLDKGYLRFDGIKIRVIFDVNGDPWFNGQDVVQALGYTDLKKTLKRMINEHNRNQLKYINHEYNVKDIHPNSVYLTEVGLYKLIMRSNMPKAEKIQDWIAEEVLPSTRKYGYYKIRQEYDARVIELNNELKNTKEERQKIIEDCKKQKFPDGGIVYVIDYSTEYDEIYRICMTGNMKKRKQIYDTHSFHNRKVKFIQISNCPNILKSFLKLVLKNYKYYYGDGNEKDFFMCSLDKIKSSIKNCIGILECNDEYTEYDSDTQTGGNNNLTNYKNFIDDKISRFKNKIHTYETVSYELQKYIDN